MWSYSKTRERGNSTVTQLLTVKVITDKYREAGISVSLCLQTGMTLNGNSWGVGSVRKEG